MEIWAFVVLVSSVHLSAPKIFLVFSPPAKKQIVDLDFQAFKIISSRRCQIRPKKCLILLMSLCHQ